MNKSNCFKTFRLVHRKFPIGIVVIGYGLHVYHILYLEFVVHIDDNWREYGIQHIDVSCLNRSQLHVYLVFSTIHISYYYQMKTGSHNKSITNNVLAYHFCNFCSNKLKNHLHIKCYFSFVCYVLSENIYSANECALQIKFYAQ